MLIPKFELPSINKTAKMLNIVLKAEDCELILLSRKFSTADLRGKNIKGAKI